MYKVHAHSQALNKLQSLEQNVQCIAQKKESIKNKTNKKNECTIHSWSMLVHVAQSSPGFFGLLTLSSSGFKTKASVVVMLHLCPTCDPILFLWLLGLKPQIELITLSPANFHSLVFWHYSVVDGSLEEAKLAGKKRKEEGDIKKFES